METMYDKLYAEYEQYNVGGISVATLGSDLNSDFNEDEPLNRLRIQDRYCQAPEKD